MDVLEFPLASDVAPPLGSFLLMQALYCSLSRVETPSLPMEASEFCFCVIGQQGFTKLPKWQPLLLPWTKFCVCVPGSAHDLTEASCPL